MDYQKKALRAGAVAVLLAISLRLLGLGGLPFLSGKVVSRQVLSALLYLQTGRVAAKPLPQPTAPEESQTQPPAETVKQLPVFTSADLERVQVKYSCDYRPELLSLLTQPLNWNLQGDQPTVLIIHTHGTESYEKAPGEDYPEVSIYHTLKEEYNMLCIGEEVARVLEAGGICVLHDRSYHDYPSYNGSYGNARVTIEEYLRKYPSINMVLDIHRDASDGENGTQLTTAGTVGGQPASQLMVVVGTDATGNYHPDWQKNLALALKLTAMLERQEPGITRPVHLRSERFNMDMTAGSLLIEVGAAGDSREQALLAANALARGILALAQGTG